MKQGGRVGSTGEFKPQILETCLLAFTETWISEADHNEELFLTGFGSLTRLDHSPENTGKNGGGGVCLYVNQRSCHTVVVHEKLCTPDFKVLSVSLWPHYLPREFQQQSFTLVYIHPRANAAALVQLIDDATHRFDSICPNAQKCILGEFNHCALRKTPKTICVLLQHGK